MTLGEYSALCFAGVLSFEDGVKLTKARGEAMQLASDLEPTGMMAALGGTEEKVLMLCKTVSSRTGLSLSIGNYLCGGNYAITGHRDACKVAKELSREYGVKLLPLSVSGAFHSSYMSPAVPILREALSIVQLNSPRIPVFANIDANTKNDPESIRTALLEQVTSPVQWEQTMKKILLSEPVPICYELGPGNVCGNIAKKIRKDIVVKQIS